MNDGSDISTSFIYLDTKEIVNSIREHQALWFILVVFISILPFHSKVSLLSVFKKARMCLCKLNSVTDTVMIKAVNFIKQSRPMEVEETVLRENAIYFASQHDDLHPPYEVSMKVNGKLITFELDTGAGVTIISEKSLDPLPPVSSTNIPIHDYSGKKLNVLGTFTAEVEHEGKSFHLLVYVIEGDYQNLLGRNWINCFTRIECPAKHVNGMDYKNVITLQRRRIGVPSSSYNSPSLLQRENPNLLMCYNGLKKICDGALLKYRNLEA
ncbi:unnamed protein product [Hymenolepis diminuta]|uniref:Retropepsins domain-containing protein n=1 Tax=Hymenolepis diminuta TaxID=6216 RepID=A0A564Z5V9_HYMDI|nr:unnamed protein product [Hymenolepis diminuta]